MTKNTQSGEGFKYNSVLWLRVGRGLEMSFSTNVIIFV